MWKKSKLPIFLLAVVAMLSVFYIFSNEDDDIATGGGIPGETKNAVFAEARLELLSARDKEIKELEAQIAAGNLSQTDITEIVTQIDELYNLKYSEVELENAIMAMGYDEAFVSVSGSSITINILADEFSNSQFVSVALTAKEKFSKNHAVKIAITNPSD